MSETLGQALLLLRPLSALAARRLPLALVVRYAAAWVAIFVLAWFAVTIVPSARRLI